ncbi:MAG: TetR/AcrR family transcriptional regulator [Firmicutes bacterium]|nr:TetR/AcrR family transcriptional regulator [Bacillota bacterium]
MNLKNDDVVQDKRTEILEAAELIFTSRGYAAARMDDIAEAAGVAKGTLYLYFSSKQELFVSLLEARTEEYVRTVDGWLADIQSADECMHVLVTLRGQFFVRNQRLAESASHSMLGFPKELQLRVWNIRRELERPTIDVLNRVLPKDYPVDPAQVAAVVNGAIDYTVGTYLLDDQPVILADIARNIEYILGPGLTQVQQEKRQTGS